MTDKSKYIFAEESCLYSQDPNTAAGGFKHIVCYQIYTDRDSEDKQDNYRGFWKQIMD